MQRKLNDEFIREYSEEFSEKITSEFFSDKERITGKEILNVSPSKQVNFFILKILFRKWQEEMKKLESPFFNYKNPEVRKAMVQFMNALSQHIEISGDHFITMVEEAVADTLLLAMDPGSYLSLEFEEMDVTRVTSKMTKPVLKYIKVHHEDIDEFFAHNDEVDIDEFTERAEHYFKDADVESVVYQQVELLSQVLPLDIDDLYYHEEDDDEEFPEISEENEESEDLELSLDEGDEGNYELEEDFPMDELEDDTAQHTTSYFDENQEEVSNESEIIEEDPVKKEQESEDENETRLVEETPVTTTDSEDEELSEPDESVNQKYAERSPTVNDRYTAENTTVADRLDKTSVNNIMEAISVNHRYMFTKELFDGDREAFVAAIDEMDSKDSFDDAVESLVQNYANKLSWDMNSDEVKELLKVIFRRFR